MRLRLGDEQEPSCPGSFIRFIRFMTPVYLCLMKTSSSFQGHLRTYGPFLTTPASRGVSGPTVLARWKLLDGKQ